MARSLILACGNPLRGDDGVALQVAHSLQVLHPGAEIHIICGQQWTPELAEDISHSELVIFVDASASLPAGELRLKVVTVTPDSPTTVTTHALGPAELLLLARELYGTVPARAFFLSIGGQSFEHTDQLSDVVRQAIPAACARIHALLTGER